MLVENSMKCIAPIAEPIVMKIRGKSATIQVFHKLCLSDLINGESLAINHNTVEYWMESHRNQVFYLAHRELVKQARFSWLITQ